jgi:HSP20 family protein
MTVLTRLTPARDLAAVEIDRLNRMFDHLFTGAPAGSATWAPAVDIFETGEHAVVIKAEIPAMKREDIKVTFENNVLTIEGERALDASVPREQYHRLERSHGAFRRSFTLPVSVDSTQAHAAYQDGVLTITLPRREDSKPRQIAVNE